MNITLSLPVTDEFLADVLGTATEGGSNYWAHIRYTESTPGGNWAEAAVCDHGGGCGTKESKTVGLEQIKAGIQVMLERGECANRYKSTLYQALVEADAGMVDAELADLILQAYFFDGEVVYG